MPEEEEIEACVRCGRHVPTSEQIEAGYKGPLFDELEDGSPVCEHCYTARDLEEAMWLILGGIGSDVLFQAKMVREGKRLDLVADWIEEIGRHLEQLSDDLKAHRDFEEDMDERLEDE